MLKRIRLVLQVPVFSLPCLTVTADMPCVLPDGRQSSKHHLWPRFRWTQLPPLDGPRQTAIDIVPYVTTQSFALNLTIDVSCMVPLRGDLVCLCADLCQLTTAVCAAFMRRA
jgi:hypothetical protein